MDSETLYNQLKGKNPEEFEPILSRFLSETDEEAIQDYNTYDDLENFSKIWLIIKKNNLGDLAVKFIKKLILIKQEDPTRNKFMIGFSNNSENTVNNLNFLQKYDVSLPKIILDTYTTPEKKLLFESHTRIEIINQIQGIKVEA